VRVVSVISTRAAIDKPGPRKTRDSRFVVGMRLYRDPLPPECIAQVTRHKRARGERNPPPAKRRRDEKFESYRSVGDSPHLEKPGVTSVFHDDEWPYGEFVDDANVGAS